MRRVLLLRLRPKFARFCGNIFLLTNFGMSVLVVNAEMLRIVSLSNGAIETRHLNGAVRVPLIPGYSVVPGVIDVLASDSTSNELAKESKRFAHVSFSSCFSLHAA